MHRCYDEMHTHNLNINSCFNLPSRRLESRLSTRPRMRSTLCGIISPSLTFSITIFIFQFDDAVLWRLLTTRPLLCCMMPYFFSKRQKESTTSRTTATATTTKEAKTKRYNYQISFFSHEDKLGELSRGKGATFGETFVAFTTTFKGLVSAKEKPLSKIHREKQGTYIHSGEIV